MRIAQDEDVCASDLAVTITRALEGFAVAAESYQLLTTVLASLRTLRLHFEVQLTEYTQLLNEAWRTSAGEDLAHIGTQLGRLIETMHRMYAEISEQLTILETISEKKILADLLEKAQA